MYKFFFKEKNNKSRNLSESDQSSTTRRPIPNQPEIYITVTEPSIEIVEIGSTVRFRCDARSRRNRVIMILL